MVGQGNTVSGGAGPLPKGRILQEIPPKRKKPSAVAGKVSFCFVAQFMEPGPKRLKVTLLRLTFEVPDHVGATCPEKLAIKSRYLDFLVVFFVVFLDDFLAAFFTAMALSPPFYESIYGWQKSESMFFSDETVFFT
jgi:hypothetical protein